MATEEKENPYEGFGTGGKFRKRPLRKTQTTPYDRPSTSLRNPTTNNNNNNKGWFSKVVDPAQRLITYSAHSLFSSLFRKRLPPPQSNASSSGAETEQGMRVSHQEETMFVSNNFSGKQQGAVGNGESGAQINVSDGGRLTELEKLLRQKTFTRSEIDHLTALMRSRTVDAPIQEEEKRTEVVPSEATPSSVRKDEDPKTPIVQNMAENRLALTPYVTSRVPSEDVASPAELAKAYMGSRPSKVSSSMLSGQSPAVREGPAFLKSDDNLPLNSPIMSIVPRTVTHAGVHENGFANPRTRGRSAIYSMARTPYARIYPTSTVKGFRHDVEGEPSSSTQSTLDHDMLYGSKQGSVKRRSSSLYNDIGSVGPIRRIRHKANLYSRSGLGVDAAQPPSSSMSKPIVLDEDKHSHMNLSVENVGDTRASMCGALPSKSSEMASKILQQLDKLVSPKEKSTESRLPTVNDNSSLKLSPSMLHGQALRSMEIVDSSKLLDTVKDNRSNVSPGNLSDSSQKLTSQINKVENGSLKLIAPSGEKNDFISTAKSVDSSPIKSVAYPPQKKRAFHMSAHEDCLDLEDDVCPNGSAENEMTSPTAKAVKDTSCTEAVAQENSRPLSVVTPSTSSTIGQEAHVGTYVITDGSGVGAKGAVLTSMTSSIPDQTSKPAAADTQSIFGSHNPASPNGSLAIAPVFSFANKVAPLTNSGSIFGSEKVVSSKEFGADVPLVNFGSNGNAEKVPHMPFTSSSVGGESTFPNFSASYDSKLGSSISSATVTVATDSMPKVRESSNDDTKTNIGSVRPPELLASSAAMTPLLTSTSTFTFGQSNGSLATSTSLSSPFTTQNVFSSSLLAASSSSISATSTPAIIPSSNSNSSNSLVVSSSSSTPYFQFGSSSVQSTDLPVSSSGSEPLETKNMQDAGNSNVSSTAFGSSSAAVGSTGSGLFGFSSSAMTTVTSQTQGSVIGSSNGSLLNAQASPASSGFATSTQTQSVPFGSSAPSLSFGLTGNTAFSSGNSFSSTPATSAAFSFGNSSFNSSSSATNIFNSGTTFGLSTSASTSAANSVSSNSGTNSALFGSSSWQPSKSSPFGSAFNSSSSPSAFGLGTSASTSAANSVSSNSGTNSALFGSSSWQPSKSSPFGSTFNSSPSPSGFSFGTSASVPSSSPTMFSSTPQFSFTSAAATGSTQPAFGNSNSVFKFGSAPVNNDQMTMEDSMAEDTVQAIPPAIPAFGQQPTPFGAPTQSGASPFQFGSQQNTTLPNPSPFQASGSAEFSGGGGSFSLGTGGGDKSGRRIVKVKNRQRKR